ncbi:MAG: HAD family hydrolase [Cellulomonadaceae bacterium]
MTSHDPYPAPARLPAAVLWDMDGTLIDSETYWIAAEARLVERFGGRWTTADGLGLVGHALESSAGILQAHGVPLEVPQIIEELIDAVGTQLAARMPWQPGALELLDRFAAAGVPCALVTMSYGSLARHLVAAAPAGSFAVTVTGDEVDQGKPHPEAYLRAAQALGVEVTECLAIEDSPPGVASALASGARTIAVRGHAPVGPQPGLTRVASLEQIDDPLIAQVLAGEVVDLVAADA